MRALNRILALIVLTVSLVSCAHHAVVAGDTERGLASWYGSNYQGHKTASGERFNMNGLTAAHKTLPMNSIVRVKSLTTGKEVSVRINDRGPYGQNRIIDLSYAAAQRLGIDRTGMDLVEIQVVSVP